MEKMSLDTIELGNLLWGHSRGNYFIDREEWQEPFADFLYRNNFDGYGNKLDFYEMTFENDTFIVRPYYWGDDEDIASLPNFVYKPTNFAISWYKYPLRDAYASHDITTEEFLEILQKCEESLKQ